MRCIEIKEPGWAIMCMEGLIETWDVLKYAAPEKFQPNLIRLIETWDVLKLVQPFTDNAGILINRNMRCIEINQQ